MTTQILVGDCRQVLTTLADQSVQCCVTSPPYWGLRDYGTGTWEGGDPECEHRSPTMREGRNENRAKLAGSAATNSYQLLLAQLRPCGKCGAVKRDLQIGLESTPEAYIEQIVDVFREVRRVLRKDGTVWLNLGDSYTDSGRGKDPEQGTTLKGGRRNQAESRKVNVRETTNSGLRPKNLVGIPWRVALALQADGWYLRSDVIWAKKNTMPESVTDRPTRSHEYVFLLAQSERYYYDHKAVRTPLKPGSLLRLGQDLDGQQGSLRANAAVRSDRPFKPAIFGGKHKSAESSKQTRLQSGNRWEQSPEQGANLRNVWHIDEDEISQFLAWKQEMIERGELPDVWNVSTKPFKDAHFATFPDTLIEPCIKAGTRPGDTVLDPFGGAGTTALVCDRLDRNAILIELNPDFAAMSDSRLKADAPLFREAP
jgi:DNA modification methylase